MKLRLLILLAAALLAAAPAAAQTVKTLGYNTTNGNVVYGGTNPLTFTNPLQFATNARAQTRTNLGGTAVGDSLFTAASAGDAATAISLGTTNIAVFKGVTVSGANISGTALLENGGFAVSDDDTNNANSVFQFLGTASERLRANARLDLGLGLPALTNTSNSSFRTAIGLGATNDVLFNNLTTSGTLTATGNVTMNGVANTAPSQTASSGSSLMTRDLVDARYEYARNPTTTTITNNATLTNIVSVPLGIGTWTVKMFWDMNATTNSGTRHGFEFTGSATVRLVRTRATSGGSVGAAVLVSGNLDLGLAETSTLAFVTGIYEVSSSGTLFLKAAQNVSSADATTVGTFAHILAEKIE